MTPLKAIKEKCLDCCCGQQAEVRQCQATNCPLWNFRTGHDTSKPKKEMTEGQRNAMAERMKLARMAKKS